MLESQSSFTMNSFHKEDDKELEKALCQITFLEKEIESRVSFVEVLDDLISEHESSFQTPDQLVNELKILIRHELEQLKNFNQIVGCHYSFKNFINQFTEVHVGLTKGDVELIKLIRIGLDTKEIASIKNVEPLSIKTAKYRLKKKFKICEEESLTEYIYSFGIDGNKK